LDITASWACEIKRPHFSIGHGLSNLTSTLIYLQIELVGEPRSCQSK
jgi:hypothetical protein